MNQAKQSGIPLLAALCLAMALAGCAGPKRLYEWGNYQDNVYKHLKGQSDSPEQQIIDMEKDLERMSGKGQTPPPGFYGHLGLMYLNVGRNDQAAQAWNKEKTLYPESGQYMDFLLNNMKKQGG